jgi:hypothetical protein
LATLDENARLEELPFMPQMLGYCGKKFRVRKCAHKLCDTAFGTGGRQMTDAVFLDSRCSSIGQMPSFACRVILPMSAAFLRSPDYAPR